MERTFFWGSAFQVFGQGRGGMLKSAKRLKFQEMRRFDPLFLLTRLLVADYDITCILYIHEVRRVG